MAIAYTCKDTFAGTRTVPSWIGTKVGVRPKMNAIWVAVTSEDDGVNCTVATSPGKAVSSGKAPVMMRAGKRVSPKLGLLGEHETMNPFAAEKAWFIVRDVYDTFKLDLFLWWVSKSDLLMWERDDKWGIKVKHPRGQRSHGSENLKDKELAS